MKKERAREEYSDYVLRKVLWDDPKDEIVLRMVANEVSAPDAENIYREAFAQRLKIIRSISWGKFRKGLVLLLVGLAMYYCLWVISEGFSALSIRAVLIPAIPAGYGLWLFCAGIAGVLTAGTKRGSVADFE